MTNSKSISKDSSSKKDNEEEEEEIKTCYILKDLISKATPST